ncbi:MAG TPA: outer membrane beta-barrel protein [Vicinamibacterales bacterium]|nr:outer membrane beta-barrel protein [Vicinamibacterales bacterium]
MKRLLTTLVLAIASTAAAATAASAQGVSFGPIGGGAGYQVTNLGVSSTRSTFFPLGFDVHVSSPVTEPYGVVADVSWNHRTETSLGFGPDASDNVFSIAAGGTYANSDAVSFQFLVGINHDTVAVGSASASSTAMMLQPGVMYVMPVGQFHAFLGAHVRLVFSNSNGGGVVFNAGFEYVPRKKKP